MIVMIADIQQNKSLKIFEILKKIVIFADVMLFIE